jgi:GTP-binding protein
MFVDQAKIHVKAGDGGNGCLAFRREKFVPRGGPSGGDGGCGGDVRFRSNPHLNTLLPFRFRQHFKGQRGAHGSGNNRQGRKGADLVVEVPVGTQVFNEETGELLFDFNAPGQVAVIARGGIGGRGNAAFATSTNQAPRRVEEGKPGEEFRLKLELKVLADVGLIGFPNAGKSTLISVISAARPKIAEYPFTTLSPHLGVVSLHEYHSVVVADIPGLIEGAHEGSGLGDQFLRHVERCHLLIHLVDVSGMGRDDPIEAFKAVNNELCQYDPRLGEKPQVVVASKLDTADQEKLEKLAAFCFDNGLEFLSISAATGEGVRELKSALAKHFGEPEK